MQYLYKPEPMPLKLIGLIIFLFILAVGQIATLIIEGKEDKRKYGATKDKWYFNN